MTDNYATRYAARRADTARAETQASAVYGACCRAVGRAASDHIGAYRICPARKCRRARRCAGDPLVCRDLVETWPLSWIDESLLIDDVYNDTVRQFRKGAWRG